MSTFTIIYSGTLEKTTVKISPNQSLFEIFEKCCESQNINPSKYELCYSNKILDLRQTVSLSNLPKNATLMIKPITKARNQVVTVCVQLENTGERSVGEFINNQSLWEIINTLFPERFLDSSLEISCLYMRTEVSGIDKLQETKLSTLGILSGKVAIKLKVTKPNNVHSPIKSDEQNKLSKYKKDFNQNMSEKVSSLQTSIATKLEVLKKKMIKKKNDQKEIQSPLNTSKVKSEEQDYVIHDDLIELQVNGRKVILFSQEDKQRLTCAKDIPDDFFEITKDDVKIMYSDLQKERTILEERPLETQKLREEKQKKDEKKYKFTIIRLYFPFDHLVLQTIFKPSDAIEELIELAGKFVKVNNFYLYTAPPKKILDAKSTFFKEKLVPAALVQFGGHQTKVLKDEFKQQVSSFINVASYTLNLKSLRNSENLDKTSQQNNKNEQESNQATLDRMEKEECLKNLLFKK